MLPQENRLNKYSAFKATYHLKKTVANALFVLYTGKDKTEDIKTRIGFVVSKKIHKRAVKRNRIKRLAREAVRIILKKDKPLKWKSMIFQARTKALDSNFHEVYDSIEQLIEKAESKF